MPRAQSGIGPYADLDGEGPVAKGAARGHVRKKMPMLPLVLSSDSHVFEPPDLWQTRIDRAFRDRAPRIERIDGADQIVVEVPAPRHEASRGAVSRRLR